MFGIISSHNNKGQFGKLYYFENVAIIGKYRVIGETQQSLIWTSTTDRREISEFHFQNYWRESKRFEWYDIVYRAESVAELMDMIEGRPELQNLWNVLHQRL